jgi:hypothetical protein
VNANVNHDEQSLIYEMVTYQGIPIDVALVRDRLYATLMFTSLGIPMLWQGMEFSAPRGWASGGERLSYRPVEWALYPTPRGQTHFAWYRSLVRQRRLNPALYRGTMSFLAEYLPEKTLAWAFSDTASNAKVVAVANFRSTPQVVRNIPWPATGTWYDIATQVELLVSGAALDSLSIPAFTAFVYTNVSDAVLAAVRGRPESLPETFVLHQNYPNPFNPSTTFSFELPEASEVRLALYDVLGREVAVVVNQWMNAGVHKVSYDGRTGNDGGGSNLPSGVYLYRLTAGSYTRTLKMVLLR